VVVGPDPSLRDRKRSETYERWLELARDDDFLGVQNYERMRYDADREVPAPPDLPHNQMRSAVEPDSLAAAVRYAHEGSGRPILITEHGIATDDDTLRAAFIPDAVAELETVVADGVPVLGYLHWTLMDNFEWVFGYGQQLGLHEVDRTTFTRTPKPSARAYADLVASYEDRPVHADRDRGTSPVIPDGDA
jgi:beta-glucosidase